MSAKIGALLRNTCGLLSYYVVFPAHGRPDIRCAVAMTRLRDYAFLRNPLRRSQSFGPLGSYDIKPSTVIAHL